MITRDAAGKPFHHTFRPEMSPKQMLRMGVFGGTYFARRPRDWHELPAAWRDGVTQLLPFEQYDKSLNRFKVRSGQTYQQWRDNGWIRDGDPLGWFQWYCRYYLGRRCADDDWQIGRWRSYRRHVGQLKQLCRRAGKRLDDPTVAPALRQGLLHWAYDPYCRREARARTPAARHPKERA